MSKKKKKRRPRATSLRQYHALRITKELERLDLSIRGLAKLSDVSRQLLSGFLNSPHRNISLDVLEKIYDALDAAGEGD